MCGIVLGVGSDDHLQTDPNWFFEIRIRNRIRWKTYNPIRNRNRKNSSKPVRIRSETENPNPNPESMISPKNSVSGPKITWKTHIWLSHRYHEVDQRWKVDISGKEIRQIGFPMYCSVFFGLFPCHFWVITWKSAFRIAIRIRLVWRIRSKSDVFR